MSRPPARDRKEVAAIFCVALAAAAANLPALVPGFIQDDHPIVENNPLVRDLGRLPDIWKRAWWSVGDRPLPDLYRPVTMVSFALNRAVAGPSAAGYRIVNLGLHALVSILVLLLARRVAGAAPAGARLTTSRASAGPVAAALLFAVHPVHTEVLGLVVGRAELLAAAGVLGCVLAFLHGRERELAGRKFLAAYTAAVAFFVLGFLSKEGAVVAPFAALAADRLLVRRGLAWRFHLATLAALAGVLALRAAAIGRLDSAGLVHFVDNPIAHLPFLTGRLTALAVVARYAVLLVLPARLSIDYSFDAIPAARGLEADVVAGGAIVLAWIGAALFLWRRRPGAAFALVLAALAFVPVANLVFPIGTIMAERLLYLPSAGVCMLAGLALGRLAALEGGAPAGASRAGRRAAIAAAAVLVLAGAMRSQIRLMDWADDFTIFRSALRASPRSVKVHFNYGAACEERGDDEGALRAYLDALAIWPRFADAHYNLAGVYGRRGAWSQALEAYRAALREQPANVQYLVNAAHALNALGRHAEAREQLRAAIDLDRGSDRAWTTLGAADLALGDAAAAARDYEEAVRLQPGNPEYHANLGLARSRAGDREAAVASWRRALELRPGDPDLVAGLATTLAEAGQASAAAGLLRQAAGAQPGNPILRNHLGRALESAGQVEEAEAAYRDAIRLAPSAPIPRRNLGLLLYRAGRREEAHAVLEEAAALEGGRLDGEAGKALAALAGRGGRK